MTSTALTTTTTTTTTTLATSSGGLIAGKLNVKLGKVELTATELQVRVVSPIYRMFGLIGMLLGRRAKGKLALTVPLGRIRSVTRSKYGLNKKILDVTMDDGPCHRLMVDDFDQFTAALRGQLAATGTAAWEVAPA